MPGSILLQQAAQNAEFSDAVSNVGRCRAHQLFAGATLCFRYSYKALQF